MKRKVRYYRTWCGTYGSPLWRVLLGWWRLLWRPWCWPNAVRLQKQAGGFEMGLSFRWYEQRCECPAPGGGLCHPCHMSRTVATQPRADDINQSC